MTFLPHHPLIELCALTSTGMSNRLLLLAFKNPDVLQARFFLTITLALHPAISNVDVPNISV